ncbi:hypothetical protein KCP70_24910 [Salmonella enterica subsp. enterica]|nr:hypothetical protein KCP70_24910 [Salmonella enterica subsp. enterica]
MQAVTGSGKTAAFGLGALHRIDVTLFQTQAYSLLSDAGAGGSGCRLRRPRPRFAKYRGPDLVWRAALGAQRATQRPHIIVATPAPAGSFTKRNRIAGCAAIILVRMK